MQITTRRSVLTGAGVSTAALAVWAGFPSMEEEEIWEINQWVEKRYPSFPSHWPESIRQNAEMAVQRLLRDHPGKTIVSDVGECCTVGDPRMPADIIDHMTGKPMDFCLTRTVRLQDVKAA